LLDDVFDFVIFIFSENYNLAVFTDMLYIVLAAEFLDIAFVCRLCFCMHTVWMHLRVNWTEE